MILDIYYGTLVFIFGLMMGSFFNVCIYRIPKEESIVSPPSHCPKCGTGLKFFDLVPVLSYIFLKGKCRYCKEKYSIRYSVVELLTGLIYLSLYFKYSLSIELLAGLYLMSVLIIVFFIDYDHKIIPHGITLTGVLGGIAVMVYCFIINSGIFGNTRWWYHLLGILPGSGALFLVVVIGLIIYKSDEVMGMGDVYIFAPIGIFLGFKLCFLNLIISIFIAGFFSLLLIILRKKGRKDTIPFGPFIVIGTFIVLLWGETFLNWYLNLF